MPYTKNNLIGKIVRLIKQINLRFVYSFTHMLKENVAKYKKEAAFEAFVIEDGLLIIGQNPFYLT